MTWNLPKQRVSIAIVTLIGVATSILGLSLGGVVRATMEGGKIPHARSSVVPFIPGKPLTITIEHPFYSDQSDQSLVNYAEIRDSTDTNFIGFLLPLNATGPVSKQNQGVQKVKSNRLTVVFDTAHIYPTAPVAQTVANPVAFPTAYASAPTVGSGSILCIHTSEGTDTCPSGPNQILLETVNVTY